MKTSNFAKGRRLTGFLRIGLGIIVALTLAMGGIVLERGPVQAIVSVTPPAVVQSIPACQPWSQQFVVVNTCPDPTNVFYWKTGVWPAWADLNPATGELKCCPGVADVGGPYNFGIVVTELNFPCCWPPPPCIIVVPVNITVTAMVASCVTAIDATYYPVAWETMPFSMALSATGGTGTLTWSATGLPVGLTVTDNTSGMISGIPAPGTCGVYTVTATVTDNGTCPSCCLPISRDFTLFVDCWSNYIVLIPISTGCDFSVAIGPGLAEGQTKILINGALQATLAGGGSGAFTSVPCQSNVVMVDQTVPGPDLNTRFEVIGSNYKMVNDVDNYAYFDYARQVLIETGSNPVGVAQPSGAGFYSVGGYFNGSAPSPVDSINQKGEKFIFREWSLPDGSINPNRDLVFTVSSTGKAIAGYNTYYQLNIISDYPSVSESSWELKDSAASYSLALQDVPIPNFWGVIGGVMRPVNASGTHVMTGPATVKILWNYDYTVPIIIIVVIVLLIIGLVVFLVLMLNRKAPVASAVPATAVAQAPKTPAGTTEVGPTEKPNFCPKCGNPVEKDAEFCKKCGNKLVKG